MNANRLVKIIKKFLRFFIIWGPALVLMFLIFLVSNTPASKLPKFSGVDILIKKGGHILAYALLGLSLIRGIGHYNLRTFIWVVGFTLIYALSDEYHQSFISGRNAAFMDIGFDVLGCVLGQFLYVCKNIIRELIHYFPDSFR